jgi:hypothetical protein
MATLRQHSNLVRMLCALAAVQYDSDVLPIMHLILMIRFQNIRGKEAAVLNSYEP